MQVRFHNLSAARFAGRRPQIMEPDLRSDSLPILATTEDSAFIQSGIPQLAHAVRDGARFVLVIFDNGSTGDYAQPRLPALVTECGVKFVKEINPCHREIFRTALNQAAEYTRSDEGGMAVIIARGPCRLLDGMARDLPIASSCESCFDGYAVESKPTSIFELAQQVALRQKQI